jgi:hypothetical protein
MSYQYQTADYADVTRAFLSGKHVISPGGELVAGEDHSQTFSINTTVTPIPRLYLSPTFTYQPSMTTTAADGSGSSAVVPYRGSTYNVMANATYVLDKRSQLFMGYAFSEADYTQTNFAGGVPLGMDYHKHDFQVGLSRRFSTNVAARLQYRFDYYNEPTAASAANYRAQAVFFTVTWKLP